MEHQYECSRKDKRLLVLFALGIMILFLNIEGVKGRDEEFETGWLEIHGHTPGLFRVDLTLHHPDPIPASGIAEDLVNSAFPQKTATFKTPGTERVLGLKRTKEGELISVPVSPRLSYFLGMPIPINSAAADDLVLVHGIGPALAVNIVDYLRTHGPLNSADELDKVPGIGRRMKQRLSNNFIFTSPEDSE